jgi:hypothetical protein
METDTTGLVKKVTPYIKAACTLSGLTFDDLRNAKQRRRDSHIVLVRFALYRALSSIGITNKEISQIFQVKYSYFYIIMPQIERLYASSPMFKNLCDRINKTQPTAH